MLCINDEQNRNSVCIGHNTMYTRLFFEWKRIHCLERMAKNPQTIRQNNEVTEPIAV